MKYLENDTIKLRALESADVPFLMAMENDSAAWESGANIQPFSAQTLRDYIGSQTADIYADKQLRLVICLKESNTPIGLADLYDFSPRHRHAWVAIIVAENFRNKGIAHSSLDLLARYAFGFLHMRLLMSMVANDNPESLSLFKNAGYTICGQFPNYYLRPKGVADAVCLQLLNPMETKE